jgi:hypothetical protein
LLKNILFLTVLGLFVCQPAIFAQKPNYSGRWILNFEKSKLEPTQNEFIADEVFKGRPGDHHNIWVFDREIPK